MTTPCYPITAEAANLIVTLIDCEMAYDQESRHLQLSDESTELLYGAAEVLADPGLVVSQAFALAGLRQRAMSQTPEDLRAYVSALEAQIGSLTQERNQLLALRTAVRGLEQQAEDQRRAYDGRSGGQPYWQGRRDQAGFLRDKLRGVLREVQDVAPEVHQS